MLVNISKIKINDGRRPVNQETVRQLADSIREIGLINPITITKDCTLISGAHRIEAFKLLGKTEITAAFMDITGLKAELAEIDENLIRNEDHYTIRSGRLLRRKEIYEALHPETKAGIAGGKARQGSASEIISFAEDTAQKTGVSKRTIEQEIQLAKNLVPEVSEIVREADIPKTDALKLARMEPEKQKAIADKIASGEAKSVDEALPVISGDKPKPHIAQNSGNNEWYTPAEYIAAARSVMGTIDLDPASCAVANETVKADTYYTLADDGLTHKWKGRVWMNPPYEGELISKFVNKLRDHTAAGDIDEAVVLVNNATETAWFTVLAAAAQAVVFPKSRIKFYKPDGVLGAPLQGQAILYIGEHSERFLQVFGSFGWGAVICAE